MENPSQAHPHRNPATRTISNLFFFLSLSYVSTSLVAASLLSLINFFITVNLVENDLLDVSLNTSKFWPFYVILFSFFLFFILSYFYFIRNRNISSTSAHAQGSSGGIHIRRTSNRRWHSTALRPNPAIPRGCTSLLIAVTFFS